MRELVARVAARFVPLETIYFYNVNRDADLEGRSHRVRLERSIAAFARARRVIPGGVNSPVRAFGAVGLSPVFMKSGSGAMIYDLDGHEYVDYVMSWGPLILGHAHPAVTRAIAATAMRGTSFGTPTEFESELAELVISMVPSVERVRFVSSGTEATMRGGAPGARLYRPRKSSSSPAAITVTPTPFLITAGSGALTHGMPDSPGVTEGTARDTDRRCRSTTSPRSSAHSPRIPKRSPA